MGAQPSAQAAATRAAAAAAAKAAKDRGNEDAPLVLPPLPQVFVVGLKPEFKRFSNESLKFAGRVQARFEKNFSSVKSGWGIDSKLYETIFDVPSTVASAASAAVDPALLPPDSPSKAESASSASSGASAIPAFASWDTDANGVTDVLEILSALILIARADFESKLSAIFELFDFDSNECLSLDEMSIGVRSSVLGVCKACGITEPPSHELERIATEAFHSADILKDGKITRHEFLQWIVCTPKVFQTLLRFGTTDVEPVTKKYADIQSRAIATRKIQTLYKSTKLKQGGRLTLSQRHTFKQKEEVVNAAAAAAGGSPLGLNRAGSTLTSSPSGVVPAVVKHEKKQFTNLATAETKARAGHFDLRELKQHKAIFDSIDKDYSGSISVKELAEFFKLGPIQDDTSRIFASMDADGSGFISFDELLRCLYPQKTIKELKLMAASVDVPEVTVELITEWRQIFEDTDVACVGHVKIGEFLQTLRQRKDSQKYEPFLKGYVLRNPEIPFSFRQFIVDVFGSQAMFAPHLKDIIRKAEQKRVRALTEDQLKEMEEAFRLFDRDGSGVVSVAELERYFLKESLSARGAAKPPKLAGAKSASFNPGSGGGSSSRDETSSGLRRADLVALFAQLDSNGDRKLTFDEFKRFFRNLWDTSGGADTAPLTARSGTAASSATATTTSAAAGGSPAKPKLTPVKSGSGAAPNSASKATPKK